MADIFDEVEDKREELEAEWNELVAVERNAALRKAAEEFDAAYSIKKRAWMRNRVLKLVTELPIIDQGIATQPRERHLPTGTRLKLKQMKIGDNELFEHTNSEVIAAIRSCAYSLRDDGIILKTETTPSESGTILSVTRVIAQVEA